MIKLKILLGLVALVVSAKAMAFFDDPPGHATTRIPNFTNNIYEDVFRGEKPASFLPYWYGFHFWRDRVGATAIPQLHQWTEHLYSEVLKADNLMNVDPKGIRHFCPKYVDLDREHKAMFWVRLISIIASFESSYDQTDSFREPNMQGVVSAGLLQISVGSSQREDYNCDMISSDPEQGFKDLKDPKKNLSCGVRIMNHWIGRDQVFADYSPEDGGYWRGLARYWGPFRHPRLRNEASRYWDEIAQRRDEWQEQTRRRDSRLSDLLKEARVEGRPWGQWDWRARSTVPHPSLLQEQFDQREQKTLTSIVRLANQTGFCF